MAERASTKKGSKSAKGTTRTRTGSAGFSAEEKAAMRERAREMKAAAAGADGEQALLEKVAEMPDEDRTKAERIHAIVKANAPQLTSRTYYGMPAYSKDDKVVCFFQSAAKFKARYATLGFTDKANIDAGAMWPTYYALKEIGSAEEEKITKLIKKAVS